jgi:hypothetical protein
MNNLGLFKEILVSTPHGSLRSCPVLSPSPSPAQPASCPFGASSSYSNPALFIPFILFFSAVLGIEPSASCMLGNALSLELSP